MAETELTKLQNIGPVLEQKLLEAGITTPEELINLGSERAFLRLKGICPTACLNMLLALEGAIQGTRWHLLPKYRKEELKEFLNLKHIKSR